MAQKKSSSKLSTPRTAAAVRGKPKVEKAKAAKPRATKSKAPTVRATKVNIANESVAKLKVNELIPHKSLVEKPPRKKTIVTGIVGLSTEAGVFVIATTEQGTEELFDFRLAVKEPFPRAVNVGAAKCIRAKHIVTDITTQPARQIYLAFISVPSGLEVEGNHLYRARTKKKHELFFYAPTQRYQLFEGDKLIRILATLSSGFKELIPRVLGKSHSLTQQFLVVLQRKAEVELWDAAQKKVKDLLKEGRLDGAVSILEPLVFRGQPNHQAEKLMGHLLYSSVHKPEGLSHAPSRVGLKQLATEILIAERLLKSRLC